MTFDVGDVVQMGQYKYVVLEVMPVANQNNYALAAEKHFQHPSLFDKEFQHWLVFWMTDNEIKRNRGGDKPIDNLLKKEQHATSRNQT